jgi:tRNA U34 5-methylaminomethyl-2-thiouridine-forming methyltransferase MnmC
MVIQNIRLWLDDRWFKSRQSLRICLFTTAFRPALRPTQPPIQWEPGALSLGVKRLSREADHSPPSSAEVKNVWTCISTPSIRLHGVVLS